MSQWNDPNTQAWIEQHEQRAVRHSVDVGDHQVSWRQYGDASNEPLLLIHGGHGSWMHWARNIDVLSEKFSLFVVDLPGYGDSSDPLFGEFGDLLTVTEQMGRLHSEEIRMKEDSIHRMALERDRARDEVKRLISELDFERGKRADFISKIKSTFSNKLDTLLTDN